MTATDLLRATSLDALSALLPLADDRAVLNAGASVAAEIDGCECMSVKPSQWDADRFDILYAESVRRGTFSR